MTDQLIGAPTLDGHSPSTIGYGIMRSLREWMIDGRCPLGTEARLTDVKRR